MRRFIVVGLRVLHVDNAKTAITGVAGRGLDALARRQSGKHQILDACPRKIFGNRCGREGTVGRLTIHAILRLWREGWRDLRERIRAERIQSGHALPKRSHVRLAEMAVQVRSIVRLATETEINNRHARLSKRGEQSPRIRDHHAVASLVNIIETRGIQLRMVTPERSLWLQIVPLHIDDDKRGR